MQQKIDELDSSIESKLIDIIVKENKSIKEAVDILNSTNKDLRKKDIYNAGLNLKNIIKWFIMFFYFTEKIIKYTLFNIFII